MFKSIYAKYVCTFVAILVASFLIIGIAISSILDNYSERAKLDLMSNAADSVSDYIAEEMKTEGYRNVADVVKDGNKGLEAILEAVSSSTDDITVLVSNNNGRIMAAEGFEKTRISDNDSIPDALMNEISSGNEISKKRELKEVFDAPRYVYAVPVYAPNGDICGAVMVCASSGMLTNLLQLILRTTVITLGLVLLATLIAVFVITERITSPLKEISRAAKSFAAGKFDVRVPVKGRDEVAELAVAFNNMAESLNNYDTMRNTFMSNVSHDLRSPMTSIAGFIDGILDGVIPKEKHEYYLRIVSSEVRRLSRLVSSLLDLSRIQAGERKFSMMTFDLCELGREIIISSEQRINEKHLDVEFDVDEDNIEVCADRDAIHQVCYNLCDNALKFASDGGKFRISVKRLKNKKVLFSVYNEGQGISPDDLPFVFERFYKSDKSRGLNKSGVGLGLFISKTIIEAHHEKIWVESEYGKNCCFSFTLSTLS